MKYSEVTRNATARETPVQSATAVMKTVMPVRIIRRPITRKIKIIWLIILVVTLFVLGAAGTYHIIQSPSAFINSSEYQAVYLTDGSVYFGKLHFLNDGSERLTDIYYPQKPATATDSSVSSSTDQSSANSTQSTALVKFGSELLGGEDQIIFSKTEVAYWVNLRSNSKVTQAIQSYVKSQ